MHNDSRIADHYEQPDLAAAIAAGFSELGKPIDTLTVDDLAAVDEFHVGGRAATASFMERLELGPQTRVLDVGAGLGGPARYAAATFGCEVVGIDLTPSYVEAASTITTWVGLEDRVSFRLVDAGAADLGPSSFDAAYLMHVGMNVSDKTALFTTVAAALVPGGTFGIYDLARTDDGELRLPVPWASSAETNFLATQVAYETSLVAAGFEIVSARERGDLAGAFVDIASNAADPDRRPPASPVGLQLVMGSTIGAKVANLAAALRSEVVTPIELIACR